jgi:hypothetical protein
MKLAVLFAVLAVLVLSADAGKSIFKGFKKDRQNKCRDCLTSCVQTYCDATKAVQSTYWEQVRENLEHDLELIAAATSDSNPNKSSKMSELGDLWSQPPGAANCVHGSADNTCFAACSRVYSSFSSEFDATRFFKKKFVKDAKDTQESGKKYTH